MMISKILPLLFLSCLALASCGSGLQIAKGPLDRSGSDTEETEAEEGESTETTATTPRKTSSSTPAPISGNPFDVPDVTGDLPAERELSPVRTPASPAPGEPREPDGTQPTVRAPAPGE